MSCDVKLNHGDGEAIQVDEVNEILENEIESYEVDASGAGIAADTNASGDPCAGPAPRITSQREVIQLLSEVGKPVIVQPTNERSYFKREALRKSVNKCTVGKLHPTRPTKACKKYLILRFPYRNAVISFNEPKLKYLVKKRHRTRRHEEPQPDTDALPISFDDYLDQLDASYQLFLMSNSPPDALSATDSDLDVADVKKYKSTLLSAINSKIIDVIMKTKEKSESFVCTISSGDKKRNEYFLELEYKSGLPFRVGLKVRVTVADRDVFGDVVSRIRYGDKLRITLKLRRDGNFGRELVNMAACETRPIGMVGHLLLQAKALLALEQLPLHTEFLYPVMQSLSSGIELYFTPGFEDRFKACIDFYKDSVQKVIDTAALNQPDVSRICVIDDYDESKMTDIFIDSVKYLVDERDKIIDMQEITVLSGNQNDDDDKILKLVIISRSMNVLDELYGIGIEKQDCYSVETDTPEILEMLERKMKKSEDQELKKVYDVIASASKNMSPEEEMKFEQAIKTGRQIFLHSCRYVIGRIEDLLNDEIICRLLLKKSRTFDVAVVHNASYFSEAELISLLMFGVSKLICFTVIAQKQGNTIADRMLRKASESSEVSSKSPVLDRSVYHQREEDAKKLAYEKKKESWKHAHSYKSDAVRFVADVRTQECHQYQAQRTYHPPQLIHARGRGRDSGRGRGRGQDTGSNTQPNNTANDAYQSLRSPYQRGGRGRGHHRF